MMLKPGVKPTSLQPELLLGIMVAKHVYLEIGKEFTLTSLNDGEHMPGSLHYDGLACDLRSRHLHDPGMVAQRIRERLTDDYDVVVEKDHIHLEFQPKG